jgi:hypothetical protein
MPRCTKMREIFTSSIVATDYYTAGGHHGIQQCHLEEF